MNAPERGALAMAAGRGAPRTAATACGVDAMVDENRFRDVMSRLVTGVALVTCRLDGSVHGLTVNAVSSVSLNPPLVLVCLDRRGNSHDPVIASGAFAVSVLTSDQEEMAHRFARGTHRERFAGVEFRDSSSGSPVLPDALAWLDCRVRAVHPAGDHSIVVGEVLGCGAGEGDPLVFFRSEYGR